MNVLIIGASRTGGGNGRIKAYKSFLESKGHSIDTLRYPDSLSSKLSFYYIRGLSRLQGHEKRHMKFTADQFEKVIRKGHYDAVICIDHPLAYVLTKDLGCKKIFSYEAAEVEELYYSKNYGSLERIHAFREMELEILQKSDYVIFPWRTTEDYVRKHIWNGKNFVTLKYGCYPQEKKATYFSPPSIVVLGNVGYYWCNRELLSYLTRVSPFSIDIYGKNRPQSKFHLNYKGFASSTDVLKNYQFGLNTVSRGPVKLHSSRVLSYLAYGLPTLSPDWLEYSHELRGVIPFNEENFVSLVEEFSDPDKWEKISNEAYEQSKELDWSIVLQPLEKMLSS